MHKKTFLKSYFRPRLYHSKVLSTSLNWKYMQGNNGKEGATTVLILLNKAHRQFCLTISELVKTVKIHIFKILYLTAYP